MSAVPQQALPSGNLALTPEGCLACILMDIFSCSASLLPTGAPGSTPGPKPRVR